MTVMLCSFGPSPQIMRLFCQGNVVENDDKGFDELKLRMGRCMESEIDLAGARAIILLHVFKVQTSCGFGVPLVGKLDNNQELNRDLESGKNFINRDTITQWASKMSEKNALRGYQKNTNYQSLDGLNGLRSARRARGQWMLIEDTKSWVKRVGCQWEALIVGILMTLSVLCALHISGVLVVGQIHSALQF